MPLQIQEIRAAGAIGPEVRAAWDRLASGAGLPSCLSAWMLAAHAHVPGDGALQVLVARDGDEVAAVLPLESTRWSGRLPTTEHRLLASLLSHRIAPLCAPGREEEAAAAFGAHLGDAVGGRPCFLQLEWLDVRSPWPDLLRRHWSRPAALRRDAAMTTPIVVLDPDGDDERFYGAYSKNLRKSVRRALRETGRRGGVVRRAEDPARLDADVRAVLALHRRRFAAKGQASSIGERQERAVRAAAPRLLEGGHLRLWLVEHEGEVVGGDLHLVAGSRLLAWNGGIAPEWARESLGLVLLDAAVRDAHALGVSVLDLGPGDQPFKRRLARHADPVVSRSLWPAGLGLPVARTRLAPKHARGHFRTMVGRIPPERRAALKRLAG